MESIYIYIFDSKNAFKKAIYYLQKHLITIRLNGNKVTSNDERPSVNCRFIKLYSIIDFVLLPYYTDFICILNI